MKQDKKQNIRAMSDVELSKRLTQIIKELVDARMKLTTGALKNTNEIKVLKNEMAIIKTIQTQRLLEKTEQ